MLHEKIPYRVRRSAPQWIKWYYAYLSLLIKKANVKVSFWIRDSMIDDFFKDKEIFFILAIGRSGTQFLVKLLNNDPKALVVHEPFIEAIPHQEAFHDLRKAEDYILNFRKKEIYLGIHNLNVEVYGEVNSFLRRHCYALKKAFPKVKLVHLVMDGRDVVRSVYARETMTPNAYDTRMIYPSKDDPFSSRWNKMSRFEKLCWYWMVENRFLRECIGDSPVQFEKIISDYNYFKETLLDTLGLDIPKGIWEREVKKPRNITIKHKPPHWRK